MVPGRRTWRERSNGLIAGCAAVVVLSAGCTSGGGGAAPGMTSAGGRAPVPAATNPPGGGQPVWLCRPGASPDPCVSDLAAEVVTASGARSVQEAAPAGDSKFDCFYVYPTVSPEPGPNADLTIQPAETLAARHQASRFSTVCRVWAPMYRQVTLAALFTGGVSALDTAYDSLLSDWRYYLEHDNGGRPVVFIGHSQGAAMLIRLLAEQVDPNPALRHRMVAAILAGGNLQVPTDKAAGATLKNIPLCTSTSAAGCAIAYSTFGSEPPADALFGRPGRGVSLMSLQLQSTGQQVACVNPAALGGGSAALNPYFARSGTVPWVTYPGLYRASCRSAAGATWLQVDTVKTPGDRRPTVSPDLGPAWGYHGDDVSLALGNLVSDVAGLEAAYGH